MTCRSEIESEEAWDYYIRHAPEKEAWDALGDVLRLARDFAEQHKPTSDRMEKMFAAGAAIYAERFFGTEWVPF